MTEILSCLQDRQAEVIAVKCVSPRTQQNTVSFEPRPHRSHSPLMRRFNLLGYDAEKNAWCNSKHRQLRNTCAQRTSKYNEKM